MAAPVNDNKWGATGMFWPRWSPWLAKQPLDRVSQTLLLACLQPPPGLAVRLGTVVVPLGSMVEPARCRPYSLRCSGCGGR